MKSDSEIAKLFKKQRDHAKRGLSNQYDNTIACQEYYAAENSTYQDTVQFVDDLGRRRRSMVNFQKIQQSVDAVVGFFAQNRRQAKYLAHINQDQAQQLYSRNMNALNGYHRENMNADQIESRQDLDLTVNGYGITETDLSYLKGNATTSPNGEILKTRIDPMNGYWDSNARAPNITDARFCGYHDDYDLKDALALLQNSKEDDFEAVSDTDSQDQAGYVFNPWGGLYDKIKLDNSVEWSAKDEDMVRVYNHQWFEYQTFYRAKNPLYTINDVLTALHAKARLDIIASQIKSDGPEDIASRDMFDFNPSAQELTFDEATKRLLMQEFGDQIQPVAFKRKVYYTAVISGTHVFHAFKSISQQGFSIKFKTGKFNERAKIWIGMVNAMMEPMRYYNKAVTEIMFTIASNAKGGVYVEEDAVEDIADFESKYAKTDAVISVLPGTLASGKIQDKARPAVPTGLENILMLCDQALQQNGVDPAFLGQTNPDETGVLYKRRIRQIISKMWWVADAGTLYQKEDARLMADLIPIWVENNTGQWIRITGPDGADQFAQISSDMLAPEYSVTIQEGAETPEDRAETAQFIGTMADKFLSIGDVAKAGALYAEAIEMMPSLDGDVKTRLSGVLVGDGQTVPMAQFQQVQAQLQQATSMLTQAQVDEIKSKAALNYAKIPEAQASARQKIASGMKDIEDAHQKNIETQVIRRHAGHTNVTV